MTAEHQHDHESRGNDGSSAAGKWILIGFLAIAGFFLIVEHRAHLYGWLPYLLLLACPLMHLLHGHGGRGSHRGHRSAGTSAEHARRNGEQPESGKE
ncbi:MAG TPA: DUF2933 domain-containing protein [Burkholderiales bacterium]|nr:DUF2933 domain-containing protein [Burkholderiales bacterium]